MSEAGKVLHLYVEVRSVPEDEGKVTGRGDDGHLTLQCLDAPPPSQRSSVRSSLDLSSAFQPQARAGSRSLPSSKSTSRHSVSFQLREPDATGSPTQVHRNDVFCDRFGQILKVLSLGTQQGQPESLARSHPSDTDPHRRRDLIPPSSTYSDRLTVPSTPSHYSRSSELSGVEDEGGKTSVVTFGYIEKANVHSRCASGCQSESDNPYDRLEGHMLPPHLRKRLSDPMRYTCQPRQGYPYPIKPNAPHCLSPGASPCIQTSTMDAVARDATVRALEEFGSPELRRKFSGHLTENGSPTLPRHYQAPRCRSWAGSPVLPRGTLTLPSKTQLLEMDRAVCYGSVNGIPRSPATDHLCAHTGYHFTPNPRCQSQPQSHQRPWMGLDGSRMASKFHPPLPSGRPTDIQHEVPSNMHLNTNHPRACYTASVGTPHILNQCCISSTTNASPSAQDAARYSASDNSNLSSKTYQRSSRCSSRTSDTVSPTSSRRSFSPSSNADVACRLATEAAKLSTIFAERRTPSPTPSHPESLQSESPKIGGSLPRESQPFTESRKANNQTPRWKTDKPIPQTRPGRISPLLPQKSLSSPASPALPARLHRAATYQSPVLDPRQQKGASATENLSTLHRHLPPQYTGERKPPGMEQRPYNHLFYGSARGSPELCRRLLSSQNTEAKPVSWTSRHQEWRENGLIQDRDDLCEEHYRKQTASAYNPSKDQHRRTMGGDKGTNESVQRNQRPVIFKDQKEDIQDHSAGAACSSQSSSGVTGSLGDSLQPDRIDRLSPETSSQCSHDTADTGSGIQVC